MSPYIYDFMHCLSHLQIGLFCYKNGYCVLFIVAAKAYCISLPQLSYLLTFDFLCKMWCTDSGVDKESSLLW